MQWFILCSQPQLLFNGGRISLRAYNCAATTVIHRVVTIQSGDYSRGGDHSRVVTIQGGQGFMVAVNKTCPWATALDLVCLLP